MYVFDLATDGCFIYVGAELNSDFYRKGTYEVTGDTLELTFIYEGEIEEIAVCKLIDDRFIYNDSEYIKINSSSNGNSDNTDTNDEIKEPVIMEPIM